jgi:hypothetical protein
MQYWIILGKPDEDENFDADHDALAALTSKF